MLKRRGSWGALKLISGYAGFRFKDQMQDDYYKLICVFLLDFFRSPNKKTIHNKISLDLS